MHEDGQVRYKWLAVAALFFVLQAAYVLMPVDLVPDLVPVVGWLDDLLVMAVGLAGTAASGYAAWPKDRGDPSHQIASRDVIDATDLSSGLPPQSLREEQGRRVRTRLPGRHPRPVILAAHPSVVSLALRR